MVWQTADAVDPLQIDNSVLLATKRSRQTALSLGNEENDIRPDD
jgi:hypothetical protein